MNKELRRVSVATLAMFLALFVSTSVIQVFAVDDLQADDRNVRTLYASYSAERGPILVGNSPIAESVRVDDEYEFLRTYPEPFPYAHVTGYFTLNQGVTGIESAFNDFLTGTANEQFLDQLSAIVTGQSPRGAAVELTVDPVVQQAAYEAMGDLTGSTGVRSSSSSKHRSSRRPGASSRSCRRRATTRTGSPRTAPPKCWRSTTSCSLPTVTRSSIARSAATSTLPARSSSSSSRQRRSTAAPSTPTTSSPTRLVSPCR